MTKSVGSLPISVPLQNTAWIHESDTNQPSYSACEGHVKISEGAPSFNQHFVSESARDGVWPHSQPNATAAFVTPATIAEGIAGNLDIPRLVEFPQSNGFRMDRKLSEDVISEPDDPAGYAASSAIPWHIWLPSEPLLENQIHSDNANLTDGTISKELRTVGLRPTNTNEDLEKGLYPTMGILHERTRTSTTYSGHFKPEDDPNTNTFPISSNSPCSYSTQASPSYNMSRNSVFQEPSSSGDFPFFSPFSEYSLTHGPQSLHYPQSSNLLLSYPCSETRRPWSSAYLGSKSGRNELECSDRNHNVFHAQSLGYHPKGGSPFEELYISYSPLSKASISECDSFSYVRDLTRKLKLSSNW
jgi:hypothetical protein